MKVECGPKALSFALLFVRILLKFQYTRQTPLALYGLCSLSLLDIQARGL